MTDSGSIIFQPLSDERLAQLWELANAPFDMARWLPLWRSWGWPYEPHKDDIYGFWFGWEDSEIWINGYLRASRIPMCVVGFAAWEDFDLEFGDDPAAYAGEQAAFDAIFRDEQRRAAACFGTPLRAGSEPREDGTALHYCIWRADCGLVILRQSDMDPQFGRLIHFWLEAGAGPEPPAELEAWLEARHRWEDSDG